MEESYKSLKKSIDSNFDELEALILQFHGQNSSTTTDQEVFIDESDYEDSFPDPTPSDHLRSLDDYYDAFEAWVDREEVPQGKRLSFFLRGLLPDIRLNVTSYNPKSYQDAYAIARIQADPTTQSDHNQRFSKNSSACYQQNFSFNSHKHHLPAFVSPATTHPASVTNSDSWSTIINGITGTTTSTAPSAYSEEFQVVNPIQKSHVPNAVPPAMQQHQVHSQNAAEHLDMHNPVQGNSNKPTFGNSMTHSAESYTPTYILPLCKYSCIAAGDVAAITSDLNFVSHPSGLAMTLISSMNLTNSTSSLIPPTFWFDTGQSPRLLYDHPSCMLFTEKLHFWSGWTFRQSPSATIRAKGLLQQKSPFTRTFTLRITIFIQIITGLRALKIILLLSSTDRDDQAFLFHYFQFLNQRQYVLAVANVGDPCLSTDTNAPARTLVSGTVVSNNHQPSVLRAQRRWYDEAPLKKSHFVSSPVDPRRRCRSHPGGVRTTPAAYFDVRRLDRTRLGTSSLSTAGDCNTSNQEKWSKQIIEEEDEWKTKKKQSTCLKYSSGWKTHGWLRSKGRRCKTMQIQGAIAAAS